jgi:hypothetical protein
MASPRIATRDVRPYVQNRQPFFNHSESLWGEWHKTYNPFHTDHDEVYVVYSYRPSWPLFVYDPATGDWYENEERISRTTSKHRTCAHPLTDTVLVSREVLRSISARGMAGAVVARMKEAA